jgi:hypothetical protein
MTRSRSKTRPAGRTGIGRRAVIAGAGSLLAFPAIHARAQTSGVALVIGNSKYQWESQLPNVRRDAPEIVRRFQALGLQTEFIQDVGREAMRQAIDKFKSASRGARLSAFYFAGHGVTWGRANYLVPADADLTNPNVVPTLIPGRSVRDAMVEAAHGLKIFDSCRNNPADGWRQVEAQRNAYVTYAAVDRQPNLLELFSTAPGRVALDGPAGENSPFAAALLRQLDGQSVDIQTLPTRLRRDLLIATEGRQVLWDINTYQGPFVINGTRGQSAANRSGWARDPSSIMELTNAYAYARENGFFLPGGLIAHRMAGNSRDSWKIGSFKFVADSPAGRDPALIIVMSIEGGRSAEVIVTGKGPTGFYWRFVTGTVSGDRLEYVPRDGAARYVFSWNDARSGSLSQLSEGHAARPAYNTSFTRLDG